MKSGNLKAVLFTLPNILTAVRILLAPVFFVLFIAEDPLLKQLSLVVFVIAAITDWYDGIIARSSGMVTNLGKFLDPLADKVLTSLAFIAFATIHLMPWWMVVVIIARDIFITVLRVVAESRDAHIVTSKSAQWKTFIQMAALYYVLLLVVAQTVPWIATDAGETIALLLHPTFIYAVMLAVTLLTLFTGIQYIYDNRSFITRLFRTPEKAAP